MSRTNQALINTYLKSVTKKENQATSAEDQVLFLYLLLTLGRPPYVSGPQFLHLYNGANTAYPFYGAGNSDDQILSYE